MSCVHQAMADNVEEALSKAGCEPKHIEGYPSANWVLMDYGDIILHIFDDTPYCGRTEFRLCYIRSVAQCTIQKFNLKAHTYTSSYTGVP